jgi:flagellar hook-associated protein 1 FlgK
MTQVSSFLGLQTALRGILAQQRALDVTAHNIANAQTAGYSRQEASLTAFRPLELQGGAVAGGAGAFLGQGVEVEAFRRMRDGFADLQFRAQSMVAGERETLAQGLAGVEETLGEPGEAGLNALLQRFWDGWHDLANQPADIAARQALVSHAASLTNGLNDLDRRLATLQGYAAQEEAHLTGADSPVAPMARELATLTTRIRQEQAAGSAPNDLLDRRDLLLDTLSALGQVSVTDMNADGVADVGFGGAAQPLVDGATGAVTWPQALPSPGGKIGGLRALQTTIGAYRSDLDALTARLVADVNAAHTPPDFFAPGGTTAATVSVAVTAATVRAGTSGAPGENDIARAIGGMRNGAIDAAWATLVRRVGGETADARQAQETAGALLGSIEDRRASVAGVSMDEEMTNMVRFQRGYQASARAMSTLDEMLDTLINRTGRVGL